MTRHPLNGRNHVVGRQPVFLSNGVRVVLSARTIARLANRSLLIIYHSLAFTPVKRSPSFPKDCIARRYAELHEGWYTGLPDPARTGIGAHSPLERSLLWCPGIMLMDLARARTIISAIDRPIPRRFSTR